MKIALAAPMKSYGGIERTFVTLAREFERRGVTTVFALLRDSQTPYPEELSSSMWVQDLHTRSKLDGIRKVARFVRRERPDVIITAKDHGAQVVLLSRLLFRWRAPVYVTVTNMWSQVIRRPLQRRMVRWLYPKADGIVAVSGGVKSDLCNTFGLPRSAVRVIFNPVVLRACAGDQPATPPHPWFEQGEQVPLILGIGRLERQKDFSTLIRAFTRVRAARRSRLMILGEGSQRSLLESLIEELGLMEDVALPGQVPDVAPYLRLASLFVLSSRWEGFGIVIAEALAAGIPVVATDCRSGPAEILENGKHGELVPVGDEAALAAAIERALDASVRGAVLRGAAERFAPARIADEYLDYVGSGRNGRGDGPDSEGSPADLHG